MLEITVRVNDSIVHRDFVVLVDSRYEIGNTNTGTSFLNYFNFFLENDAFLMINA